MTDSRRPEPSTGADARRASGEPAAPAAPAVRFDPRRFDANLPPGQRATASRRWQRDATPASLQALHAGTAVERLGIEFLEVGDEHLVARMPVDERTRQPAGILHGGASVVLAETLGSVAAVLCLPPGRLAVGLEINANHLRAAREGWVVGRVSPLHVGRSTHVWQVEIRDDRERLVCVSRITMAVLEGDAAG